jgi:hypothetical protein
MYVAQMTTEHYDFTATGDSEQIARLRVARGFDRHLRAVLNSEEPEDIYHREHFVGDSDGVDVSTDEGWLEVLHDWYSIRCIELDGDAVAVDMDRVI